MFVAPKPRLQARATASRVEAVAGENVKPEPHVNGSSAQTTAPISSIKQATSVESASNEGTDSQHAHTAARPDALKASLREIPHQIVARWPDVWDHIKDADAPFTPIGWVSPRTYTGLLSRFACSKARKGIPGDQLWVEIEDKVEVAPSNAEAGPALGLADGKSVTGRHGKRMLLLVEEGLPDRHIVIGTGPTSQSSSARKFSTIMCVFVVHKSKGQCLTLCSFFQCQTLQSPHWPQKAGRCCTIYSNKWSWQAFRGILPQPSRRR